MNRRGGALIPQRRIPLGRRPTPPPPVIKNVYEARPIDVLKAKSIIGEAGKLPIELVDIIMDFAEYWACSASTVDYKNLPTRHHMIRGGTSREDQFLLRTEPLGLTTWRPSSQELWRAESAPRDLVTEYTQDELQKFADGPFPTLKHPFRKIAFDITSHDQGHGGGVADRNTFRHSYTWFDAGKERFDKENTCDPDCSDKADPDAATKDIPTCAIRPLWPPVILENDQGHAAHYDHALHATPDHMIQSNQVANGNWQHHHVEWSWTDDTEPDSIAAADLEAKGRGKATGNGEFVRNLKFGDMITIWGRARFGAWVNNVERIEVQVYWAV